MGRMIWVGGFEFFVSLYFVVIDFTVLHYFSFSMRITTGSQIGTTYVPKVITWVTAIGRVGEDLLVALERRVEDDFAGGLPFGAEGGASEDAPVLEGEDGRCSVRAHGGLQGVGGPGSGGQPFR